MFASTQHYTVENLGSSLRFTLPYPRSWARSLVILLVLLSAPVSLLSIFQSPNLISLLPALYIVFTLTTWVIFLVLVVAELLWLTLGSEIVDVDDHHISIHHQIFGIGISRQLLSEKIDGVFVSRQRITWFSYSDRSFRFMNFKKGRVAINSGKNIFGEPRTFRFGSILNEVEARQIVAMIHQRFLRYRYRHPNNAG